MLSLKLLVFGAFACFVHQTGEHTVKVDAHAQNKRNHRHAHEAVVSRKKVDPSFHGVTPINCNALTLHAFLVIDPDLRQFIRDSLANDLTQAKS